MSAPAGQFRALPLRDQVPGKTSHQPMKSRGLDSTQNAADLGTGQRTYKTQADEGGLPQAAR